MTTYKASRGLTIHTVAGDPDPLTTGDIWYSSTTRKIRGAKIPTGAWAAATNTSRPGTTDPKLSGTQTAGLAITGFTAPPAAQKGEVEEYDGSSWTESGDVNTARRQDGGFGIQTAAVLTGGNLKGNRLGFVTTVWVVEILTTDGINLSARSANEAGTVFEFDWIEKLKVKINVINISLILFILALNIINNYKS